MRSLKEEMRPPTPQRRTVQLDDPTLVSLAKEKKKELLFPPVETIQLPRLTVMAEEKCSPPDLQLTTMEEPGLVELRDHSNLAPPRRKTIGELEVINIQWNSPSSQYCDTRDRDRDRDRDWSLKPPQLSIEEEEVTVAIITNQADLFDQVKMLRPSFIRFRI